MHILHEKQQYVIAKNLRKQTVLSKRFFLSLEVTKKTQYIQKTQKKIIQNLVFHCVGDMKKMVPSSFDMIVLFRAFWLFLSFS